MHTIQTESPRRKGIPATKVVLTLLCVMYAMNYMVRVNVSTAAGAFKDELASQQHRFRLDFLGICLSLPGMPNHQRLDQRSRGSASGSYRIRRDLVRGDGIYGLGQQHGCHDFWQGAAGHRRIRLAHGYARHVHMDGGGKRAFAQGITHSAARLGNAFTPPLWRD